MAGTATVFACLLVSTLSAGQRVDRPPVTRRNQENCDQPWFNLNGKCYAVVRTQDGTRFLSAHDAQKRCRDFAGGHARLASLSHPNSNAIWNHLKKHFDKELNEQSSRARRYQYYTYIGLYNPWPNDTFLWMDGSRLSSDHWAKDQPENSPEPPVENCVAARSKNGKWEAGQVNWHDFPCCEGKMESPINTVICEKDQQGAALLDLDELEMALAMECPDRFPCVEPPEIPDTTRTGNFTLNQQVTYECPVGYRFPGLNARVTITCTLHGWVPIPPTRCVEIVCEEPCSTRHAMMRQETGRRTYECDTGFIFSGGRTQVVVTCTADGWEPPVPTACRAMRCLPLPHWRDLEVIGGFKSRYEPGDVINYTCPLDSKWRNGDSYRISSCDSNETWVPALEDCSEATQKKMELLKQQMPEEATLAAALGAIAIIFILCEILLLLIMDFTHIHSTLTGWVQRLDFYNL